MGGVHSLNSLTDKLAWVLENDGKTELASEMKCACKADKDLGGYFDVPCPSHDNPLLLIPKEVRRKFFDDLFEDDIFKWQLFTEKKYEWLFHDEPLHHLYFSVSGAAAEVSGSAESYGIYLGPSLCV